MPRFDTEHSINAKLTDGFRERSSVWLIDDHARPPWWRTVRLCPEQISCRAFR